MRKFAAFIALSVLVHLLLVLGGALRLPDFKLPSESTPLSARLVPLQPEKISAPNRHAPAAASAESLLVPNTPSPTETAANKPAADNTSTSAIANTPAAVAATGGTLPAVTRALPPTGELRYTLFLGAEEFGAQPPSGRDGLRRDGLFTVGRTVQRWQIDSAGHYTLTSVSETTGLAALFARRRYAYDSRGSVTADGGLRPESFSVEREQHGATEQASAHFDWQMQRASFGAANERPQQVALPAATQDLLSFMYQLGLMPLKPGRLALPVSNGWKLETYELDVGNEELIDTPLGKLKAVPVRQIRIAGKESIALWLATEYRMLPVRIRFFDRDGKAAGEQLINDIRVTPK